MKFMDLFDAIQLLRKCRVWAVATKEMVELESPDWKALEMASYHIRMAEEALANRLKARQQ